MRCGGCIIDLLCSGKRVDEIRKTWWPTRCVEPGGQGRWMRADGREERTSWDWGKAPVPSVGVGLTEHES
jgi:hypothetical protein